MEQQQRYQPTYRLESKNPYKREVCEHLLKQIVDKEMKNYQYDVENVDELCKKLCENIKEAIKTSQYDRYKLIVVITLGEKCLQDISSSLGFLWDADRDGYAKYVYDRPDLFLIATIYALYLD